MPDACYLMLFDSPLGRPFPPRPGAEKLDQERRHLIRTLERRDMAAPLQHLEPRPGDPRREGGLLRGDLAVGVRTDHERGRRDRFQGFRQVDRPERLERPHHRGERPPCHELQVLFVESLLGLREIPRDEAEKPAPPHEQVREAADAGRHEEARLGLHAVRAADDRIEERELPPAPWSAPTASIPWTRKETRSIARSDIPAAGGIRGNSRSPGGIADEALEGAEAAGPGSAV